MKLKILLKILLFSLVLKANGQVYFPDSLALRGKATSDTLPIINHKKNIPLLILGLYSGVFYFGFNADEYQIKDKRFLNNKLLEPYFLATKDPIIIENYYHHRKTRPAYMIGMPVGYSFLIVGLASSFAYALSGARANTGRYTGPSLMLIGGAIIGVSAGVRIKSFSKLRLARNRYNELVLLNRNGLY